MQREHAARTVEMGKEADAVIRLIVGESIFKKEYSC